MIDTNRLLSDDGYLESVCGPIRRPDLVRQALLQMSIDKTLAERDRNREEVACARMALDIIQRAVWNPTCSWWVLPNDVAAFHKISVSRVQKVGSHGNSSLSEASGSSQSEAQESSSNSITPASPAPSSDQVERKGY